MATRPDGLPWVSFRQNFGCGEDYAIGAWVWRVGDRDLGRARHSGQKLDPHQHGKILVHRIVAVVDVGTAVLAKLDLERHLSIRP